MTTPFDPVMLEELRQALCLTDLRASEHVWIALKALSLSGTEVVLVYKAPTTTTPTSHDLTTQILMKKYGKQL